MINSIFTVHWAGKNFSLDRLTKWECGQTPRVQGAVKVGAFS